MAKAMADTIIRIVPVSSVERYIVISGFTQGSDQRVIKPRVSLNVMALFGPRSKTERSLSTAQSMSFRKAKKPIRKEDGLSG